MGRTTATAAAQQNRSALRPVENPCAHSDRVPASPHRRRVGERAAEPYVRLYQAAVDLRRVSHLYTYISTIGRLALPLPSCIRPTSGVARCACCVLESLLSYIEATAVFRIDRNAFYQRKSARDVLDSLLSWLSRQKSAPHTCCVNCAHMPAPGNGQAYIHR